MVALLEAQIFRGKILIGDSTIPSKISSHRQQSFRSVQSLSSAMKSSSSSFPPWNRWDVYQFDEKVLIRKGTNAFAAKPEELRKLHRGEFVI